MSTHEPLAAEEETADKNVPRAAALRHVERVRNLKAHLAAFVAGTILLTGIWTLTEYLEADGWPQRFGDEDTPGTWHLWIFYVVGAWTLFVTLKGIGTYFSRPFDRTEIEREVGRMHPRR